MHDLYLISKVLNLRLLCLSLVTHGVETGVCLFHMGQIILRHIQKIKVKVCLCHPMDVKIWKISSYHFVFPVSRIDYEFEKVLFLRNERIVMAD
jgi:hypothetical protein